VTASLIVAGVLTIVNLWSLFTQPKVPEFDAAQYGQMVESHLKKVTPAESWNEWVFHYRPMAEHGFSSLELMDRPRIEAIIAERRSLRRTLWVVIAIAAAVAAAAAFWPRAPETRRRGDTETRS
jgi:hypothetical protein